MAWIKVSDTAAMYPALLAVAEHDDADERSVDEVFGWWCRLAILSAQHWTDYVVTFAVVLQVSGTRARADRLIGMAQFAGLLSPVDLEGRRAVKLLDDPEFVHLKTAEEKAWEDQRKADNGNPAITVLVRHRDGDACRYCGKVVRFTARRGKLAGTYDHRPPGQPADAERSVVACSECNARRGNAPLEVADATLPLLPAPEHPYYHRTTRKWLHAYGALLAEHGLTPPPIQTEEIKDLRVGTQLQQPDPAPAGGVRPVTDPAPAKDVRPAPDPAPAQDVRPVTQRPADSAPAKDVRPAPADAPQRHPGDRPPRSARRRGERAPADPVKSGQVRGIQRTETPGRDGTGRDGPGLEGTGRAGTAAAPPGPPPPSRSRRRRRGRRSPRSQGES
ncbi:hypothetical protein N866_07105 [Actinotalea ferrariae CF5-4]|uniref:HNH endonuclease n=1 Tax=Actinotalea ferrariae CF5-4 TaxID=948458 RepID=A0A021VU65_9CELL|nr:hypothetical protein [Actinotalea ferrariae]EYR64668.1 hypothetical protein N866_07105 [Actinotalea ferrariae CF5-4]